MEKEKFRLNLAFKIPQTKKGLEGRGSERSLKRVSHIKPMWSMGGIFSGKVGQVSQEVGFRRGNFFPTFLGEGG